MDRSELTAVDVLLEPDEPVHARALAYNRRFLARVPPPRGFELGATRLPHVTIVQRYLRTEALEEATAAIAALLASTDREVFELVAQSPPRGDRSGADGVATVVWPIAATPALRELHVSLLAALEPFVGHDGDERAFVRPPDEPEIAASTVRYVERFVPDHSGTNYDPHLTLGPADAADRAALAEEPPATTAFRSPAIAMHQLGDHGTARRLLARWPR